MQRLMIGLTLMAAVALLPSPRPAQADQVCKQEARDQFLACKSECRDDFRAAKFTCRGIDPACGMACRAGRMSCFDDVDAILHTGQLPNGGGTLVDCTDGTDDCDQVFQAAKTACGAPCYGDPNCIACIDNPQLTHFVCRDMCRDSWRLNSTVITLKQACRETFRICAHACPPAP